MDIKNLKIKDDLSFMDYVDAIQYISSYYFIGGRYTPYYKDIGEVEGVIKYFIEGIEFGIDDSMYEAYLKNEQLRELVDKFIVDSSKFATDYTRVMKWIRENVSDIVEFEKQRIIHHNDSLDRIVEFCDIAIDLFRKLSEININSLSDENLKVAIDFMKQLQQSGISEKSLTNAFRTAANINPDKQSAEIIDSLKAENQKLKRRVANKRTNKS